jgi:hypothetical protein
VSLYNIAKALTGLVPETPLTRAQTEVKRALGAIYDQTDWSFQKGYAGWLAPGIVFQNGSTTTTPYSNLVIGDATFTQFVNNYVAPPLLTTLQYRNPAYSVYSIVAVGNSDTVAYLSIFTAGSGQAPGIYLVNGVGGTGAGAQASITVNANGTVTIPPIVTNPGGGYTLGDGLTFTLAAGGTPATFVANLNATITLDRPWMEPASGPGQPYMIYQAYFVSPVVDFRKFVEIRDTTNDQPMNFWGMTQADLAAIDPQRQDFSIPEYVVPAGVDQRPGTSTPGWQLFELWPHQGNYTPYSFSYRRRGPLPQQPSDFSMSPPHPISEDMLEHKTRELLLMDAAAKMEAKTPGSGKGMMLLASMEEKKYAYTFGHALSIDLNLDGESRTNNKLPGRWQSGAPYATMNGGQNLGGYGGSDN